MSFCWCPFSFPSPLWDTGPRVFRRSCNSLAAVLADVCVTLSYLLESLFCLIQHSTLKCSWVGNQTLGEKGWLCSPNTTGGLCLGVPAPCCGLSYFSPPFLWPLQLTTGALLTLSVLKVFDKLSYKIHDCKQILQHQTEDLPAFLFLFPGYGFCILKQPAQRALWCIMKSSSLFQTFAHFLTLRVVVFSSTYWLI